MKKQKEKIYDFGLLGEWSEKTLKLQIENCWSGVDGDYKMISAIEDNYKLKLEWIEIKIATHGERLVRKHYKTLAELWAGIKVHDTYRNELKELNKDYDKYKKTILEIEYENNKIN